MRWNVPAVLLAAVVGLLPGLPAAAQMPQQNENEVEEGSAAPAGALPKQMTTARSNRAPARTVKMDLPIRAAARSDTPEFRGEGWFQQGCAVCHLGRWRKTGQLKAYAPDLSGVLANASPEREKGVRDYIRQGSANMPGFRNAFTSTEFEELIAYLKSLEPQVH